MGKKIKRVDGDLRTDHSIIFDLINEHSRVLDLGCGDGRLLSLLINRKNCRGTGIEIDEKAVYECIANGVSACQSDIESAIKDYSDKRFDYVILEESLQQVLRPKDVILESLRVGRKVVVAIPNFCNANARSQIFFKGQVPVTKNLPFEWYDTPNLRFLSLKDFRRFCKKHKIKILNEVGINDTRIIRWNKNVRANIGIYLLEK